MSTCDVPRCTGTAVFRRSFIERPNLIPFDSCAADLGTELEGCRENELILVIRLPHEALPLTRALWDQTPCQAQPSCDHLIREHSQLGCLMPGCACRSVGPVRRNAEARSFQKGVLR